MIDPKYLRKDGKLKSQGVPLGVKEIWFLQKAREVHGPKYSYKHADFSNTHQDSSIECPLHGIFIQTLNNHLRGRGCPECAKISKTKTTQEAILSFIDIHQDTYDYSLVNYSKKDDKVVILCKKHGAFSQTPNNHLSGNGCPKCQNKDFKILYLLKCRNTNLIKIGITGNLHRRIKSIQGDLHVLGAYLVPNPVATESQLHNKFKQLAVYNPTVRNGNTEFFRLNTQEVESLQEQLIREVLTCV